MKLKKNYIKNKIWKLAVDPGGNKITGVTDLKTPNGELQVLKYSTNQYYHDCKINEKNCLMKGYYEERINVEGSMLSLVILKSRQKVWGL